MVTDVSDVHDSKARSPIVVTLGLKVIWHGDDDAQRLQQPIPPLVVHITSNDNDDDNNNYYDDKKMIIRIIPIDAIT